MVDQVLAHYRVIEKLGAGGMGEVYRAHDEQLDRDVAIKVLPASTFSDPAARARLLREARAAAALNHPHVCTIHEVGEAGGHVYIAMELITGQPLDRVIPADGMPVDQVLRYGLQIADAVAHAHDRGVVHRDLKTGNTFVTPQGRAKVLDFGLAKRASVTELADATTASRALLTEAGALAGTLPYMAPEQLRGEGADTRSDVWALGVMLFEMAAGARPFQGRTGFELSSAIVNQQPAPLPEKVTPELKAVIGRCLEKEPERRYQRAGEVHAALEAIQMRAAPQRAAWHERLDRRGWVALAALVVGAAALSVGWWAVQKPPAPATRIESLVVLPFKNLTGDSSQEYFVDGMTEALSATFSQIGTLTVISSTSAMRYKNTSKTAPQIAQELGGIDALVEGAVQRSENHLRVTVSLIHAESDRRIQTAVYARDVADVFALYRDIAQSAAREFSIAITPPDRVRLVSSRRPDPEAYDAYLKGRYHYARWPQTGTLETAIHHYEEAIAKDPTFAQGYAALAEALRPLRLATPKQRERAGWAAQRAVELDPTLSEAYAALGLVRTEEWDWSGSEAAFEQAIDLDPNSSVAHQWYAQLLRMTLRLDEALREARRAEELDPLALPVKTMVGWVLFNQHRYDEAIRVWDAVLELDPDYGLAIYNKGLVYAMKGLGEDTISAAQRARPRMSGPAPTWLLGVGYALSGQRKEAEVILRNLEESPLIAALHLFLGDKEKALGWLERGYEGRGALLPTITSEPLFDNLRDHPRFRALRANIGLP